MSDHDKIMALVSAGERLEVAAAHLMTTSLPRARERCEALEAAIGDWRRAKHDFVALPLFDGDAS